MKGKEAKETYNSFFKENYNKDVIYFSSLMNMSKKKQKIIKNAIREYGIWFEKYIKSIELLEKEDATGVIEKENSKAIENPFDIDSVRNATKIYRLTVNGAAKMIMNKYLDCICQAQITKGMDSNAILILRKEIDKEFAKGKYFTFNIIERLYNDVQKII